MVFRLPFKRLHGRAGAVRSKFAVIARVDPEVLTFMISTKIPDFARASPKRMKAYVAIDRSNHRFLDYDSWIDCGDTKDEYTLFDLQATVRRDPECLVGDLHIDTLKNVIAGVNGSVTLEERKKASIRSGLDRRLSELLK